MNSVEVITINKDYETGERCEALRIVLNNREHYVLQRIRGKAFCDQFGSARKGELVLEKKEFYSIADLINNSEQIPLFGWMPTNETCGYQMPVNLFMKAREEYSRFRELKIFANA